MSTHLSIIVVAGFAVTPFAIAAERPQPIIPLIQAEMKKVTADKEFSDADAIRVGRYILELLVGPMPEGQTFSSHVTVIDADHIDVFIAYDWKLGFTGYTIRFSHGKRRYGHVESITHARSL